MFNEIKSYIIDRFPIHFPGAVKNTILLSSMGRSGSTWISSLINFSNTHREIFEPFLPIRVPEANVFEYTQYLNPFSDSTTHFHAAKLILEGRLSRQAWLDMGNQTFYSSKRLIKDIRTNLLLGWFNHWFPDMKIVLLIRNPFSVVQSYMDLNWGIEPCGSRREIDILLSQRNLIHDYPLIQRNFKEIDPNDTFETLMFQWCVLHYVPLQQIRSMPIHITFYEHYISEPEIAIKSLYAFTGQYLDKRIFEFLNKPSRTAYSKTEFGLDNLRFGSDQVARGQQILEMFNLHQLYVDQYHPQLIS